MLHFLSHKFIFPPFQKRSGAFSLLLFSFPPLSPLVSSAAAMSSGSPLSHLINRNLCYNDVSMSLWLHAYAIRAGNPFPCLLILHTLLSAPSYCCSIPDSTSPGPLCQDRYRSQTSVKHLSSVKHFLKNLLSLFVNLSRSLNFIKYLIELTIFLYLCVGVCSGLHVLQVPVGAFRCVWSLLACGMVQQLSGAALWSVTFVWIGNADLFRLKRHELESLVRTHDQKWLSALCQSTLLSPCEADVK